MKYQSEIIKEIIDTRGHDKSSLHYESECIESWVDEDKGSYPKLCDYQSEWLNYINENPLGGFPYETLEDVTKATLNNVVPYAYKSAILKGNTLVNMVTDNTTNGYTLEQDGSSIKYAKFNLIDGFESNEIYTIIFDVSNLNIVNPNGAWIIYISSNSLSNGSADNTGIKSIIKNGKLSFAYSPNQAKKTANWFNISLHTDSGAGSTITVKNVVVLKGNHTQENIPYFEGMQSVQMPVLTTTGKNLFDGEIEVGYYNINNGTKINSDTRVRSATYIKISPNRQIIIKGSKSSSKSFFKIFYDRNKNFIGASTSEEVVTTPENAQYMTFYSVDINASIDELIQIEYGTQATSYEPYKANILTVNEVVELRSNGSVYDELDLLTGKLTQRIDEDGSVLTHEVVKTVELKVVNQDGENVSLKPIEGTMQLSTSSETINPLFSGEIPVEAITQNLASFIKE